MGSWLDLGIKTMQQQQQICMISIEFRRIHKSQLLDRQDKDIPNIVKENIESKRIVLLSLTEQWRNGSTRRIKEQNSRDAYCFLRI